MRKIYNSIWQWYEDHYILNISIALGLFLLQIVHLVWLALHVIALRVFDVSFFPISNPVFDTVIVLIDYTEIPALFSTALIYVNELRKKMNFKSFLFILLLASQLLHMFWITDEFIVTKFNDEAGSSLPVWLAWVAILIDYLEVPVIIDTTGKLLKAMNDKDLALATETIKNRD